MTAYVSTLDRRYRIHLSFRRRYDFGGAAELGLSSKATPRADSEISGALALVL